MYQYSTIPVEIALKAAGEVPLATLADLQKQVAEALTCGGSSFTADTLVLTASGRSVPISSLQVGEKILSADTATGRNQAESVGALLVHRDTNSSTT